MIATKTVLKDIKIAPPAVSTITPKLARIRMDAFIANHKNLKKEIRRCCDRLLGETLVNVSLVLQVGILVLLFVAAEFAYRRDFRKHGWTTTMAVALHSITILIVMIPSVLEEASLLTELSTAGLVTQAHVILGTTAWISGLASIAWWGIKKKTHSSLPSRFRRKWIMRMMLLIWFAALVNGIILHLFYI